MQLCNLAVFISVLACELAKGKTINEISLLDSIFSQLENTLKILAAQQLYALPNRQLSYS